MNIFKYAIVTAILVISTSANSAPVQLIYTGQITTTPGGFDAITTVGDEVTISVIVDNGGDSIFSQAWGISDTVSATFTAGNYTASFIDSWFTSSISTGFATDSTGNLLTTNWFGTGSTSPTSVDNFGNGIYFGNGDIRMSNGQSLNYTPSLQTVTAWENPVAVSAVPVPAAAWLFASGLFALLGFTRRNK